MRTAHSFGYLFLLGLAACTGGSTTSTASNVGPAGGALTLGGTTLTIPPGGLATTTHLTMANDGSPPSDFVGLTSLVRFGPDGTQFAQPATISFTLDSPGVDPVVYWSNDAGGYDELPSTVSGSTVTAAVSHFSHGFVGERHRPDGGTSNDAGTPTDSGASDAGTPTDSGASDAGPGTDAGILGLSVTLDGTPTLFATNMVVTVSGGTTTISADDSASTTHSSISISMSSTPQQTCGTGASISYTHYTSGASDGLYGASGATGSCILIVSATPSVPGDHATGSVSSATLAAINVPLNSPVSHSLANGTFDFVY